MYLIITEKQETDTSHHGGGAEKQVSLQLESHGRKCELRETETGSGVSPHRVFYICPIFFSLLIFSLQFWFHFRISAVARDFTKSGFVKPSLMSDFFQTVTGGINVDWPNPDLSFPYSV